MGRPLRDPPGILNYTYIIDGFLHQSVPLRQHEVLPELRVTGTGQRDVEVDVSSIRPYVVHRQRMQSNNGILERINKKTL